MLGLAHKVQITACWFSFGEPHIRKEGEIKGNFLFLPEYTCPAKLGSLGKVKKDKSKRGGLKKHFRGTVGEERRLMKGGHEVSFPARLTETVAFTDTPLQLFHPTQVQVPVILARIQLPYSASKGYLH